MVTNYILYGTHEEEDRFWQFSFGQDGHTDSDYKLVLALIIDS